MRSLTSFIRIALFSRKIVFVLGLLAIVSPYVIGRTPNAEAQCTSVSTAPANPKVGDTVTATASTTCPGASYALFLWFPPGSGGSGTGTHEIFDASGKTSESHTVDKAGTWSVEVDVYDATGHLLDIRSASFTVAVPIGGAEIPIDKVVLLLPFIVTAVTLLLAAVGALIYFGTKRKGKR